MRIAFAITGLEPGGAELQVVQLASALKRRGYEVAVFALRSGPLGKVLAEHGIHAGRLGPLALLHFRPQVLHGHLFHANIASRLAGLVVPAPVVISTVHSLAESSRRSAGVRYRDLAYRATNALADATVFVCTAAAERHLAANAAEPARTQVIPNGVDTTLFHPDPERRAHIRAELGLRDQEFVWLAAGRLMWKKNYPLLLRAMERQAGATLLLAGTGPDENELRGAAPPNVRFLGSRADIPALMNAADAFVLTSSVEGLPMVLLEAAASGLPCVAASVGGVPEAVLADRSGFLFAPGSLDALTAAMERMALLPEPGRQNMAREARWYAEARFDMQAVVAQWERLYQNLLARTGWT
jgi:glycosyltransferase involved in cell wall biosynthesis